VRVAFIPYVQGRNAYRDGDGRKYGLAFHNTSNNASDTAEATYAKRRTDGVSSHFYVDSDSATQSIDTLDKVGHAGSAEGNDNAICFELTGANGWTRAQWLQNIDWIMVGRVSAAVIRAHWPDGSFQVRRASVAEMKANPKVKALYGHDDMRRAWGGTTHTDPGPNFPWDHLITVIKTALGQPTTGDAEMGDMCKKGDISDDVLRLQLGLNRLLVAAGTKPEGLLKPDKDYGPATAKQVHALLGGPDDGANFNAELSLRLDDKLADLRIKAALASLPTPTPPPGPVTGPVRITGTVEIVGTAGPVVAAAS
jgi:N-acetyl-anhydromuramyl-L-alanine amidase AmpD